MVITSYASYLTRLPSSLSLSPVAIQISNAKFRKSKYDFILQVIHAYIWRDKGELTVFGIRYRLHGINVSVPFEMTNCWKLIFPLFYYCAVKLWPHIKCHDNDLPKFVSVSQILFELFTKIYSMCYYNNCVMPQLKSARECGFRINILETFFAVWFQWRNAEQNSHSHSHS